VVDQNLFLRPAHVSALRAAFLEPLACVVQGQAQIPIRDGDTVVVMGCGTIGLLHILLAKRRGARRIIVTGRHAERLELAAELGATDVVDVDQHDAVERVRELTEGFGAELVIECVGRPEAWQDASEMASQGGFVLLFGGCPSKTRASFDTGRIHYDQLTLKGVFHFTPADVLQAYHYLCEGELPVERLLSGQHPLVELPSLIERLDRGEGIKYAIVA
jgi:L-iditol 2-dehydrogenase